MGTVVGVLGDDRDLVAEPVPPATPITVMSAICALSPFMFPAFRSMIADLEDAEQNRKGQEAVLLA